MEEMALTIDKSLRRKIEKKVFDFFNILEPTGKNTDRYRRLFKSMTDKEFSKYFEDMMSDEDNNFYLEVVPYQDEPPMDNVKDALQFLGLKDEEYVFYRHEKDANGRAVRTTKPVPVLYLQVKKLRQVLSKKNAFGFDASQRSALIDQVTGDSKISRNSDAESYALLAVNADKILREISGARADNAVARNEMYRQIATQGFSRLDSLPSDLTQKASLQLFDIFLTSAGLKSDIVTEGLILTQTLQQKDKTYG